jgi:OOP family OmpA-OmpF porin
MFVKKMTSTSSAAWRRADFDMGATLTRAKEGVTRPEIYCRRDLVEERNWISEADYKEGLGLAQLAPGPLAAQLFLGQCVQSEAFCSSSRRKIAIAAALAIVTSSSFAADKPFFYAGADVGSSQFDDLSDRQNSFGGFVGYSFNQNIAVEAGYRRLADFDLNFGTTAVGVTLDQTAVSVIGTLPLSSGFNVFSRLGYNRLNATGNSSGIQAADSTSGVLYGIGAGYAFSPTVSARLELQKPSSDSTNVSVGVSFKF